MLRIIPCKSIFAFTGIVRKIIYFYAGFRRIFYSDAWIRFTWILTFSIVFIPCKTIFAFTGIVRKIIYFYAGFRRIFYSCARIRFTRILALLAVFIPCKSIFAFTGIDLCIYSGTYSCRIFFITARIRFAWIQTFFSTPEKTFCASA